MTAPPKVMLADPVEYERLRYPVIVQPKFDGIRCLFWNGVAYGRSLKPLPNYLLQRFAQDHNLHGLDGELILGLPFQGNVYHRSHGFVMKGDARGATELPADFTFYCYDTLLPGKPYGDRMAMLLTQLAGLPNVKNVESNMANDRAELDRLVEYFIDFGYEGAILRDPLGTYKHGRSTAKEGRLLKVKPWADMEGEIVGFEAWEQNNNEAFIDERGHTARSSHKENRVALDKLGALIVKIVWNGVETTVNVGTGFTDEQRIEIWQNRQSWLGKIITFRYIPYGSIDRPRHPSFKGERSAVDLGG